MAKKKYTLAQWIRMLKDLSFLLRNTELLTRKLR